MPRSRDRTRDTRLAQAWIGGADVRLLATAEHMTEQGVRAALARTPGAADERARRRSEIHAAIATEALDWTRRHPGTSLATGATQIGITPAQLAQLLGPRADLHRDPKPSRGHNRPSTTAILATHLAHADGDPSVTNYDDAARLRRDWPSSQTIVRLHGSWRAALRAAGLDVPDRPHARAYTDDQLWQAVADFVDDLHRPAYTAAAFAAWLADQPDRPSWQLIYHRLGPWRHILVRLADHRAPVGE